MAQLINPGQYCASNTKILDFIRQIDSRTYTIAVNGKYLNSLDDLKHNDIFALNFKLFGGKGGFGSLLRSFRITKSTNQNMCRDLSGRRLADVKEEARLRKWIAQKEERDKAQKRKDEEKLEKLRSGHKVKYHFKDKKYMRQRDVLLESTEDAIEAGMLSLAEKEKSESPENNHGESEKTSNSAEEVVFEELDQETYDKNQSRKRKMIPVEAPIIEKKKSKVMESVIQNEMTNNKPVAVKVITEESITLIGETSECISADEKKVFDPIDIEIYSDAKELEFYGLEHLKHELERRGLKCGGTLMERAKRLFSVKGLTPSQYPKKILSATKK